MSQNENPCPFLGELIMEYCAAYPVRKPIPKDQITTDSPCRSEGFRHCPLFLDMVSKLQSGDLGDSVLTGCGTRKEVS